MICVDCGDEAPKTIQGSCAKCFVATTPLMTLPEVIDLELCAHCDARHVGKRWVEPPKEADHQWLREEAVRESLGLHERISEPFFQLDERAQDDKHYEIQILMEGSVEGVAINDSGNVLVRQRRGVCDRCSRLHGNYFAAIIQLRATERDTESDELAQAHRLVAEELDRLQEAGNRFAFLTKGGPMHGGWDYYIGDIEAARQVSRLLKQQLGTTVQETAKLVGRREGEDVYRVTFLVRIRLFSPGDIGLWQGNIPVQVVSVNKGHVHCIDLSRQRKTRIAEASLKRLGGSELIHDAVLVNDDGHELQLMDPVSYRTQDVLRPVDWKSDGESVPVLRFEERLYLTRPTTSS